MAKKNKDQEPNASLSSVSNRDIIQRINFLYQAGTYLSSVAMCPPNVPSGGRITSSKRKQKVRRQARHPATVADISRSYVKSMHLISQKATVRMYVRLSWREWSAFTVVLACRDPALKRTLCTNCFSVLLPGSTTKVRVKCEHPLVSHSYEDSLASVTVALRSHGHAVSYTCNACGAVRRIPAPPVLDPDAPPDSASTAVAGPVAAPSAPGDATAMDVDAVAGAPPAGSRKPRKRRKRPPMARLPPLFERKVGHVVFRGNERLEE